MLSHNDITNVTNSESSGLDERGYTRPMIRTSFSVRGKGPYHIDLPKAEWTADKADQAVRAYAAELITLIDKYPQG